MNRAVLMSAMAFFAACASETPELDHATVFDESAGKVVVVVCGDAFVRCGERRLPLDAMVLELRQRTRAMSRDEVSRFVVQLLAEPQVQGSPAAQVADDGFVPDDAFESRLRLLYVYALAPPDPLSDVRLPAVS